MNARPGRFVFLFAMLALAGCAIVPPNDAVLEDSRSYVYTVRNDPNVRAYAPVEIDQAVATMRRADELAARGGTLTEVHDLATLARERATFAQQTARIKVAEVDAAAERQRLEVAARAREAEVAQRAAVDAQMQADSSRQQAMVAQQQATTAQRQADSAQQQAASVQRQALVAEGGFPGLREQMPDLGPTMTDRGLVLTLTDVAFDPGSDRLQPGGQRAVSRVAAYLTAHPELVIAVDGFTDDSGNAYRNQQLSERRALAVQSALASSGVDARRIIVRGYGPAYPIASNGTSVGRQMNSRVEIVISDRGRVIPRA
jgi:outer membrane protein OmpA-like peptidoglycan-associated protein